MERILFLAHTLESGALPAAALEALTAASQLRAACPGAALTVATWGAGAEAAAAALGGCGAGRFLAAAGADLAAPVAAVDAAAISAIVRASAATIVVAPTTSRLSRALPAAAVRLGGRVETHVASLAADADGIVATRWYYRQRLLGAVSRSHRPWLLAVDAGGYEPWAGPAAAVTVEPVEVALPAAARRTRVEGEVAGTAAARTIRPDAPLLLVAGAGWTKKQRDGATHLPDAERLILGFLERTTASLGGSKSLVEQSSGGEAVLSFMTHLHQVGQTGSSPRHRKGLATCCHGEEPHVVGWRFVRERRAVNLDPGCGWARGKADVLYVADAFEVMARLNALLEAGCPSD